jgi:hypothetical protein
MSDAKARPKVALYTQSVSRKLALHPDLVNVPFDAIAS